MTEEELSMEIFVHLEIFTEPLANVNKLLDVVDKNKLYVLINKPCTFGCHPFTLSIRNIPATHITHIYRIGTRTMEI